MAKCQATTKAGSPCKKDALEGSNFCSLPAHQLQASVVTIESLLAASAIKVEGLNSDMLKQWLPAGLNPKSGQSQLEIVVSADKVDVVRNDLLALGAIDTKLQEDLAAFSSWRLPPSENFAGQKIWEYVGICGHSTQMDYRLIERREKMALEAPDTSLMKISPPMFRLCAECRALRTALLSMPSWATRADTQCPVCNLPFLATGAAGFAKSRQDIWENLISGTRTGQFTLTDLPSRLRRKRHGYNHPAHEQDRKRGIEFEVWSKALAENLKIQRTLFPERAVELEKAQRFSMREKQIELGLIAPDEAVLDDDSEEAAA